MKHTCIVQGTPAPGRACRHVLVGGRLCGFAGACEHKRAPHQTIELEDHGQDFLEWDLDEDGRVIDARPFQAWVWTRYRVLNHLQLTPGCGVAVQGMDGQRFILKYPVKAVRGGV